jgi:hypothetical protein
MMQATNATETETSFTENLEIIQNTEPSQETQDGVARLLDRTPYASVLLAALAAALDNLGDNEARLICLDAAAAMAEHEAKTI